MLPIGGETRSAAPHEPHDGAKERECQHDENPYRFPGGRVVARLQNADERSDEYDKGPDDKYQNQNAEAQAEHRLSGSVLRECGNSLRHIGLLLFMQ